MAAFSPGFTKPEEKRAIHASQGRGESMLNQPDPRMAEYVQLREAAHPAVLEATARSATMDGLYGESRQTTYVDPAGNQVENRVEISQDTNMRWAKRRSWIVNVISFLSGVLEMILALRFVFRLLGASQENSFMLFLYRFSQVFAAPFHSIFQDQALGTRSVFELSTLVAMLVYALLAWGLAALSRMVFAPNKSGRQRFTTTRSRL